MRKFLISLDVIIALSLLVTLGLALTGHLVVVSKLQIKEAIINVDGFPFLQSQNDGTVYSVHFVK